MDATTPFEDVGHSDDAIEALVPLYIGEADPTEFKTKPTSSSSNVSVGSDSGSS